MSTQYQRCTCPHCSQDIEYAAEMSAQVIECPGCQKPLTLPESAPAGPKQGFISSVVHKLKQVGKTVIDKRSLKKLLFDAVADGVLTADETSQIRSLMENAGIDESVLSQWGHGLFKRA